MSTPLTIYKMLREDITARLVDQLDTSVSDEAKVPVINSGLVKGLPTDTRLLISIMTGDEKWPHTANIPSENVGMVDYIGAIGGSVNWRERFIIDMELYLAPSVDQQKAQDIADAVLARTRYALQNKNDAGNWWFDTGPDEFGTSASRVFVLNAYLTESGSETKWVHRGQVKLEFLTETLGCV